MRINLALFTVFTLGTVIAGYGCWNILEANARREVLNEAALMVDSALATRAYTSSEIQPLLKEQILNAFPPQSVPSYAATQNFTRLRANHPEYTYKEATLNPTNPMDRAVDWEADIIQRFRNHADTKEVIGERDTPMGPTLYIARPIRVQGTCLQCHSVPAAAPKSMLEHYGPDNGFGWRIDDVVGAQMVSVPFAMATASAKKAFGGFIISLASVFAAVLLAVNGLLYWLVVRPVRTLAKRADQVSLGEDLAQEFPQSGAREIASLGRSFNRMRKSLEKAMSMLDG